MQEYAKHLLTLVAIFFLSVLYFQPSSLDADQQDMIESEEVDTEKVEPKIVCVTSNLARHGLDTQMRKHGAQFSRNYHFSSPGGVHAVQHRCYFKFPISELSCFNPRVINHQYLTHNGFVPSPSFHGGRPGQQCYFTQNALGRYTNLVRVLGGTMIDYADRQILQNATVRTMHEAVERIRD